MQIKTVGELRGFLADVMIGIREGKVKSDQANAIAKIAAQINQSLAVEVNTALQLERMGKDRPIAGSMLIGTIAPESAPAIPEPEPPEDGGDDEAAVWIEAAVRHLDTFTEPKQLEKFVAGFSHRLETLMETRPELHSKITIAINETAARLRPSSLDKIDHSLRDDLLWCDQCDMRVAPQDALGCKSRHCSLKAAA